MFPSPRLVVLCAATVLAVAPAIILATEKTVTQQIQDDSLETLTLDQARAEFGSPFERERFPLAQYRITFRSRDATRSMFCSSTPRGMTTAPLTIPSAASLGSRQSTTTVSGRSRINCIVSRADTSATRVRATAAVGSDRWP